MNITAVVLGLTLILGLGEIVMRYHRLGQPMLAWPSPLDFQEVRKPSLDRIRCRDGSEWLQRGPQTPFRPIALPAVKSPDVFRIIVYGGSATFADEFEPPGTWPSILERLLSAAYPDRDIQVINLGQICHSSTQVLLRLEELLQYEPDLLIVYSGNNEALDLVAMYQVSDTSLVRLRFRDWLRDNSHLYRGLARLAHRSWTRNISLAEEEAVHEHQWTAEDWDYIERRYRRNLELMCDLAAQADVPIMLSTVANTEERTNRPDRCFFCDSWLEAPMPNTAADASWTLDWAYDLWLAGEYRMAYEMLQSDPEMPADGGGPLVRALIERSLGDEESGRRRAQEVIRTLERDESWTKNPILGARYIVALDLTGRTERLREAYADVLQNMGGIAPEDRLYYLTRLAEFAGDESRLRSEVDEVLSRFDDVIVTGRRLSPLVVEVAGAKDAMLVRPEELIRSQNPDGRIGIGSLFDYCHFTAMGAHQMAAVFAQAVVDSGLPGSPAAGVDVLERAMAWERQPWIEGRDSLSLDRFAGVGHNIVNLRHSVPNEMSRAHAFLDSYSGGEGGLEQMVWATNVRCRFDLDEPGTAPGRSLKTYAELLQAEPDNVEILESAAICALWAGRPDLAGPHTARLMVLGDPNGVGRRLQRRISAAQEGE